MKAKEAPPAKLKEAAKWLAALVVIYLLPAFVIFDFTKAAYTVAEDTYHGKDVAWGPRPRAFAVSPNPDLPGTYTGTEWPFSVYRPVCFLWREFQNVELPGQENDR